MSFISNAEGQPHYFHTLLYGFLRASGGIQCEIEHELWSDPEGLMLFTVLLPNPLLWVPGHFTSQNPDFRHGYKSIKLLVQSTVIE